MSEENVKRLYDTIARIISKREGVNVKITVTKKNKDGISN